MSIHALRGMNDILPGDSSLWHLVEETARQLFQLYGYEEIRTPILEEKVLFTRTIGETTNIIEKEMYEFQDKGERWVVLRPEGTASVVRAYIESGRAATDPIARYFYSGPMYRRERPQKGRLREFHQIGVEAFGIASPLLDAEMIHMLDLFLKKIGVGEFEIELNSLGCPICRPKFQKAFHDFLLERKSSLCADCQRRLEKNPLRVLDCKEEGCRQASEEAPSIQEFLCDACEKEFDQVLETLGHLGSSYKINARIVRGLDYYIKTTFEFTTTLLGAQNAIAGGGRYDGLVRLLGGPNIPGVGYAIGMERLIELVKLGQSTDRKPERKKVFIAPLGEKALQEAALMAEALRKLGIAADLDYDGKSLKSQMRYADKNHATHVLILGEDELKKKTVVLRNMSTQSQEEVPFDRVKQLLQAGKS